MPQHYSDAHDFLVQAAVAIDALIAGPLISCFD
jgi:hypothetical protein